MCTNHYLTCALLFFCVCDAPSSLLPFTAALPADVTGGSVERYLLRQGRQQVLVSKSLFEVVQQCHLLVNWWTTPPLN